MLQSIMKFDASVLPHAIDNICFPLLDIVPGILFLMALE